MCEALIDDKLDDLKRRQNGLPDLLNVVMEEEIARFENKYRCGEEKKRIILEFGADISWKNWRLRPLDEGFDGKKVSKHTWE